MAGPYPPAGNLPVSYRTNVNRAVTKKWQKANTVNYDGDDWGDEDGYEEPYSAPPAGSQQPPWASRPGQPLAGGRFHSYSRSVTSPQPQDPGRRPSFDQGDERRNFSANAVAFEGPYPTAPRPPFPEPQHESNPKYDYEQQMQGPRVQPVLHLQTQRERSSLDQPRQGISHFPLDSHNNPYSAPPGPPGRRSNSSPRPTHPDLFQRQGSPVQPANQGLYGATPSANFPPRKSSLSQQASPLQFANREPSSEPQSQNQPQATQGEVKTLPFIRPADIYKRMEEEREKERRSQESSRPSFDSGKSKTSEDAAASSQGNVNSLDRRSETQPEDESSRRVKPTLEPVTERKSEYGFDNMMPTAPKSTRVDPSPDIGGFSEPPSATASSMYSNTPDPLSATSVRSGQTLPIIRGVSTFGDGLFAKISPGSAPGNGSDNLVAADTGNQAGGLRHNPSFGYRSMVQQAFDDVQKQEDTTQSEIPETVPTSDVGNVPGTSLVMSRLPDEAATTTETEPTVLKDREETGSRPTTPSTINERSALDDMSLSSTPRPSELPKSAPLPPDESSSPTPVNPLPIAGRETQQIPTEPITSSEIKSGGVPEANPAVAPDVHESKEVESYASAPNPPLVSRTSSEDWEDWQEQRKSFHAQTGIPDSYPSTNGVPSPSLRAESPAKGTVRDFTEKLEGRSRQPSLLNTPDSKAYSSRPETSRLESFRPALPGSWVSYNTNSGTLTPQQETSRPDASQASLSEQHEPAAPVDEDPVAKPPNAQRQEEEATSRSAFAAATVAGSALVGAFAGLSSQLGDRSRATAGETSEDESTKPSTPGVEHDQGAHVPGAAQSHDGSGVVSTMTDNITAESPMPPEVPAKDTPKGLHEAQATGGYFPTLGYFPAPLRTTMTNDTMTPSKPSLETPLSTEPSPRDSENDRLRKEIVRSLTPKLAHSSPAPSRTVDDEPLPRPTSMSDPLNEDPNEVSALPKEYESYWTETAGLREEDEEETSRPSGQIPPIPTGLPHHADDTSSQRSAEPALIDSSPGMLQQRFSWETATPIPSTQVIPAGSSPLLSSPATSQGKIKERGSEPGSPETIRYSGPAPILGSANRSSVGPDFSTGARRASATTSDQGLGASANMQHLEPAVLRSPIVPSSQNTPSNLRDMPFRDISALATPQQRIQAYQSSQRYHAMTDAGLGQWMQFMSSSPDHQALFSTTGRFPSERADTIHSHKSSPSRSKFQFQRAATGTDTSPSGSKQLQDDTRRLVASAGKYGGKAGSVTKKFLARGKEKLRNASGSDKSFFQARRKSQILPDTEEEPELRPHSMTSSAPPQIPPQDLRVSQEEDNSTWSLPYNEPISPVTTTKAEENLSSAVRDAPVSPATEEGEQAAEEDKKLPKSDHPRDSLVSPATEGGEIADGEKEATLRKSDHQCYSLLSPATEGGERADEEEEATLRKSDHQRYSLLSPAIEKVEQEANKQEIVPQPDHQRETLVSPINEGEQEVHEEATLPKSDHPLDTLISPANNGEQEQDTREYEEETLRRSNPPRGMPLSPNNDGEHNGYEEESLHTSSHLHDAPVIPANDAEQEQDVQEETTLRKSYQPVQSGNEVPSIMINPEAPASGIPANEKGPSLNINQVNMLNRENLVKGNVSSSSIESLTTSHPDHLSQVEEGVAAVAVGFAGAAALGTGPSHISHVDGGGMNEPGPLLGSHSAPDQPQSILSNVSAPKPGLPMGDPEHALKSVSPPAISGQEPLANGDHPTAVYTSYKDGLAAEERAQQDVGEEGVDTLPAYEGVATAEALRQRNVTPRIGPDAEIVPVTDLTAQRREEGRPRQSRPFSFAASNSLIEPINGATPHNPAERPTPHPADVSSESLNKAVSQVTVEEVIGSKSPVSYSRPFQIGPNADLHPAFRNLPDPASRGQLYSSESPLPSARRHQSHQDYHRYGQKPMNTAERDEQYRIPGPYVQEYRSPKNAPQRRDTRPWQDPEKQMPQSDRRQPQQSEPLPSQMARNSSMTGEGARMAPPTVPDRDGSRHRSLAGLFRNRSRSGSREARRQSLEPAEAARKEKRNNLLGPNSRQGSFTSGESRVSSLKNREPGREPSPLGLPRWSASTIVKDKESKKKRFSGLSSIFGRQGPKAADKDRRSSSQAAIHPLSSQQQYPQSDVQGNYSNYVSRPQNPVSMYPHGPDSFVGNRGFPTEQQLSQQQRTIDSQVVYRAPYPPQNVQQGIDSRPGNLRIDTSSMANQKGVLPTVPSVGVLNFGTNTLTETQISNTGVPSLAQPSYVSARIPDHRAASTSPTPPSATTARAIDLHKRSRSPRLGRKNSDDFPDPNADPGSAIAPSKLRAADPASQLGTFKARSPSSANRNTSAQETPWRIDLPDENSGAAAVGEASHSGSGREPLHNSTNTTAAQSHPVAELPGSKAPGHDSDDDDDGFHMSATAYPGQEWIPTGMGSHWED